MFDPEYAEVYGVPFSFIPCAGRRTEPERRPPSHPRASARRARRLRDHLPARRRLPLRAARRAPDATFDADTAPRRSPPQTCRPGRGAPSSARCSLHALDDLRERAPADGRLPLASPECSTLHLLPRRERPRASRGSSRSCCDLARAGSPSACTCKDNAFPQLLLLDELAHERRRPDLPGHRRAARGREAPDARSCSPTTPIGSTRCVDFDTTRPVWPTDPDKCHVSPRGRRHRVVGAEDGPGPGGHARGRSLREEPASASPSRTPSTARSARYLPDFLVRIDDGHGADDDLLNLILEVSGERKRDKEAKVATARTLWVPAVNNHGGFGRWAFVEITDPWDAQDPRIRAASLMPRRRAPDDDATRLAVPIGEPIERLRSSQAVHSMAPTTRPSVGLRVLARRLADRTSDATCSMHLLPPGPASLRVW